MIAKFISIIYTMHFDYNTFFYQNQYLLINLCKKWDIFCKNGDTCGLLIAIFYELRERGNPSRLATPPPFNTYISHPEAVSFLFSGLFPEFTFFTSFFSFLTFGSLSFLSFSALTGCSVRESPFTAEA